MKVIFLKNRCWRRMRRNELNAVRPGKDYVDAANHPEDGTGMIDATYSAYSDDLFSLLRFYRPVFFNRHRGCWQDC